MILPKHEQAARLSHTLSRQRTIVSIYHECRGHVDEVIAAVTAAAASKESLIQLDKKHGFSDVEFAFRCIGKRVVVFAEFVNNKDGCGIDLVPYLVTHADLLGHLTRLDRGRIRVTPNGGLLSGGFALKARDGGEITALLLRSVISDE